MVPGFFQIWVLLFSLLLVSLPLRAEPPRPDVRLVIDVSGSMKDNDPQMLRRPAVGLLVKLMPDKSKAGIWTFGHTVNVMQPHQVVDGNWKQQAESKASNIHSRAALTNIGMALDKVSYDFAKLSPDYQTSVILLTDGVVDVGKDPAKNAAARKRIVDEILPQYQQAGVTIHTVALSENVDKELMQELSVRTDGIAATAQTADELMKIFLKVFDAAAPAEQVPLKENRFVIDSSVDEFTALIFKRDEESITKLVGPDLTEISAADDGGFSKWYQGDKYDLVTVEGPMSGEWQLIADTDPDNRVTIVSNLSLVTTPLRNNLYVGEKPAFAVQLKQQDKTITRKAFLRLLQLDLSTEHQEQGVLDERSLSEGVSVPKDGIFRTELDVFNEPGEYQVSLVVDGRTFERRKSKTVVVYEPFAYDLNWVELEGGRGHYLLEVSALTPDIDLAKTQVMLRLKAPDAGMKLIPLSLDKDDVWSYQIQPSAKGTYQLNLDLDVRNTRGQTLEIAPKPLEFTYPEPKTEPEPVPEEEPEADAEPTDPAAETEEAPLEEEEKGLLEQDWFLYTALAVGNLLIVFLGFMAYRLLLGKGKKDGEELLDEESEDDAEPVAEDKSKAEKPKAAEPEPEPETPEIDDLDLGDDDDDEEPPPVTLDDLDDDDDDIGDVEDIDDTVVLGDDDFSFDEADDDSGSDEYSLDDFVDDDLLDEEDD